jgi:hypothetical protein
MDTVLSPTRLSDLPPLGQPLAGGIFVGLTTKPDGTHHAVALLPDAPAKPLAWKAAVKWAEDLEAELPTRPVAALLFANAKQHFDPSWHWTSEAFDGSCAWLQYFNYGDQSSNHKSWEGRARAVRLIQLTA